MDHTSIMVLTRMKTLIEKIVFSQQWAMEVEGLPLEKEAEESLNMLKTWNVL